MKIGIDARICDEPGYYGQYVNELVDAFCDLNTEHEIVVYRKHNLPYNRYSLLSDLKIKKIFQKEKFTLMIFFDIYIPAGYKGKYIVMQESLKEVFFPKDKYISRVMYQNKLKKAIKNSQKVVVMDTHTAMELNERLNIHEDKIEKIHGFFPKNISHHTQNLEIDIKTKHNLRGNYLVYDSGNEVHNNFERILKAIKNLKDSGTMLSLIIICEETTKDLDIRNIALNLEISTQIFFLGNVPRELEKSYYEQSSGVIFSSIYESFPFGFAKAIFYASKIYANNIPAIRDAMGESISYLDPLSIHNMADVIQAGISKKETIEYMEHLKHLSPQLAANELMAIIEK